MLRALLSLFAFWSLVLVHIPEMKGLTPDLLEFIIVILAYAGCREMSVPLTFLKGRAKGLLNCPALGVLKSLFNLSPLQEPGLEQRARVTGSLCRQDAASRG